MIRRRLPAEWEPQRAVLLAWPHALSDWADRLDAIRAEYIELIHTLLYQQPVLLLVHPRDQASLPAFDGKHDLHPVNTTFNDTWCRDYGPISLLDDQGGARALDFRFNAWGGKYDAGDDNRVNQTLLTHPVLSGFQRQPVAWELEGGAIDSDGQGRLLVNWHCLKTRHPGLSRQQISEQLRSKLMLESVMGIDLPGLPGDDTDGHIDTLARFINVNTIAYQCDRDDARSQALLDQLQLLRDREGRPYRLIGLPPVLGFDDDLPANYLNFLLVNGACLVPAYGVDSDRLAQHTLAPLLPDRRIIPVTASIMMTQFGGPHCATMHIPEPTA